MIKTLVKTVFCLLLAVPTLAQNNLERTVNYFKNTQNIATETQNWVVTDEIYNAETKFTYLYLRQVYQGVEIYNANHTVVVKNGNVLHWSGEHFGNFKINANAQAPKEITESQAIESAARQLGIQPASIKAITNNESARKNAKKMSWYDKSNISLEPIPVRKVYYRTTDNALVLCWNLEIYETSKQNYWDIIVDAENGEILEKNNWVTHCTFNAPHEHNTHKGTTTENHSSMVQNAKKEAKGNLNVKKGTGTGSYNIFLLPIESPSHGSRSLISDPNDASASPFGWHDTDGINGAEYTITRGNNVYAYKDANSDNAPDANSSPDGGSTLNFDFSYDKTLDPNSNSSASVTNMFYMCNRVHDILYHLGFDEPSGNFQSNNYNKGGSGNDAVNAEGFDGSGRNNANFSTPADGTSPRMQMFIWDYTGPKNYLKITAPASITGTYNTGTASFGRTIDTNPTSGDLVLMNDGTASPTFGCAVSPQNFANKIVVIDRGTCEFSVKAKNAQDRGAIAVIIVNNDTANPNDVAAMAIGSVGAMVTIPVVMISKNDGDIIKAKIALGTVTVTLQQTTTPADLDSAFDNGIVAHEYGHGVSTRLTGGPANSSCLNNGEQMGEGWSDYFALVLTMKVGDVGTTGRGIGTYATSQSTTGPGIRPARYSTNRSINNYTYANLPDANVSQTTTNSPHARGFVWCTILWDMTWKFVDRYGFDADLKNGNGGNKKALRLVMEGLKLQPCNPGFEDGRNAILKADKLLNAGANQDIIWEAFTGRGLGYYGSQGSSSSDIDGVASTTALPTCAADAGDILRPSSLTNPNAIRLCKGNDIGAFGKAYLRPTQKDPVSTSNPYTYGENFTYTFLLVKDDNIVANTPTGDFDFRTLTPGMYQVYGFSYRTNVKPLATYLSEKAKISLISADITGGVICGSLNNKFADASTATVEVLEDCLLANESKLNVSTRIYPNPTENVFSLQIENESGKEFEVKVYNLQGKEIIAQKIKASGKISTHNFDMQKYGKGLYFVRLESENKFLIQKLSVN